MSWKWSFLKWWLCKNLTIDCVITSSSTVTILMRGHCFVLFQNLDQPNSKPNVIMREFEHAWQFPNLFYIMKHLRTMKRHPKSYKSKCYLRSHHCILQSVTVAIKRFSLFFGLNLNIAIITFPSLAYVIHQKILQCSHTWSTYVVRTLWRITSKYRRSQCTDVQCFWDLCISSIHTLIFAVIFMKIT